jgi:hypothetical protein
MVLLEDVHVTFHTPASQGKGVSNNIKVETTIPTMSDILAMNIGIPHFEQNLQRGNITLNELKFLR